ncbi:MAG: efflux RND transporter periplasmic adaptor subunit [Bacillota bacterium]
MRKFPVRWAVITVVVLSIAGLGYWGVTYLSKGGSSGELVMASKPVTRGDMEVTVRGWGQLQATQEQDVVSGAEGIIEEILFQPGQSVTKGQVLALVDAGTLSIKLRQKELELDAKKVELAASFGVPLDQVATVDPSVALTVRAPISGRISGLALTSGSTASKGKICSVVDDSRLLIRLQLAKPLFDMLSIGTEVTFRADRFEGGTDGLVTRLDPTPIKGDAAYFYDVAVEIPNPGLLKVGDTGTLVFKAPGGEFQQVTKITSCATEETVTSAVGGRVKTIFAREGTVVKVGDPILEFDQGQALLEAMTTQLALRSLIAEVDDLRSQLANLSIVAPIDGVVISQNVGVGQQVGKGTNITRVSNFTSMNLMLRVDEMDVPKVQPGQQAQVMIWGPSGQQQVQAEVSQLGATGDPRDGLSAFNITIAIQNPGFLRPGMSAEAQIFVSKKENVILCPIEALYKEEDKWFADVVQDDDERVPVEVEVGAMNDMFAEVISGLTEGQEVVVGMTKQQEEGRPGVPIKGGVRILR